MEGTSPSAPGIIPPVREWSKDASNHCVRENIRSYWGTYDAITFLVNHELNISSLGHVLTDEEKKQEHSLKPMISRQRFVVSRTILKYILSEILLNDDIADVVLMKDRKGRILVKDNPSVYISLSYSGSTIAITLGKRKLGSDIEVVRHDYYRKIADSPIFMNNVSGTDSNDGYKIIHIWTLVESYAKLFDQNPYPLLNRRFFFTDANFVSYCIDKGEIFSLASRQDRFTDALVWLDTSGIGKV
jgi:4'-phosphopantetheinyl transferase